MFSLIPPPSFSYNHSCHNLTQPLPLFLGIALAMGTTGLLKLASSFFMVMNLSMWAKKRVGIDGSMVIHQLLTRYALSIINGFWTDFLAAVIDRLMVLRRAGCTVLVVFDGRRVSAKVANSTRAQRRAQSLEELNSQSEMVKCVQGMLKDIGTDLEDAVRANDVDRVEELLKKNAQSAAAVQEGAKKMKTAADQGVGAFAMPRAEHPISGCTLRE